MLQVVSSQVHVLRHPGSSRSSTAVAHASFAPMRGRWRMGLFLGAAGRGARGGGEERGSGTAARLVRIVDDGVARVEPEVGRVVPGVEVLRVLAPGLVVAVPLREA